jgi:hypothetical protein
MTTKREAALKLAFENWLASQGYDEDGMFGADEMEFAFGAGAEAAIAAREPDAADGELRRRVEDFARGLDHASAAGSRTRMAEVKSNIAKTLREFLADTDQQPQPAPGTEAAR